MVQQQSRDISEPFARSVAFEIKQSFGTFYVATFTARKLLQVCFVEELEATQRALDFDYRLKGTQRQRSKSRLSEIADFVNSREAAFPNTIILAANYKQDGTLLSVNEEDDNAQALRWRIQPRAKSNGAKAKVEVVEVVEVVEIEAEAEALTDNECIELIIPTNKPLANIIDGQHRLKAFLQEQVTDQAKDMPLLCAIFLDLPSAYQGYLFATINFNQKSVNKSLAYQLYGLTGDETVDRAPETWSPDRAAVTISKRLNLNPDSPFYKRIIVAAINEQLLFPQDGDNVDWRVSTATVVDGILRLFSKRPKFDRHQMFRLNHPIKSRSTLEDDGTPLRKMFREVNDLGIYQVVLHFFTAVKATLWDEAQGNSYIKKTVGIQALFEVLNYILLEFHEAGVAKLNTESFLEILKPASAFDFSAEHYQQASGIGKVQMRDEILGSIEGTLAAFIEALKSNK